MIKRSDSKASNLTIKRGTEVISRLILAVIIVFQPFRMTNVAAQQTPENYVKITTKNTSTPQIIKLGLDKSVVVELPAVASDVLVANPKTVDAVMRTSRHIYLVGKQVGQTNLFVFDGLGKQFVSIELWIEE